MITTKTYLSSWAGFYANRVNNRYYQHVQTKYSVFIDMLRQELNSGKHSMVIELGCGICNVTRALIESHPQFKYWAVDNEPMMLELSKQNLALDNDKLWSRLAHKKDVCLIAGDILNQNFWGDLAHSHGVLEHFSDEQIRQTIELQKANFKTLIHYVPSWRYEKPSFGDERLMTPQQWYNICQPSEIIEFNEGYDLILKWDLTKQ